MDLSNATIWLQNTVRSINPKRLRENSAQRFLYDHTDQIEGILNKSMNMIKSSCRKDYSGSTKLTALSTRLGRMVDNTIGERELPWWEHLDLGNLVLSTLMNFGFIKIHRDPAWTGKPTEAPYIVEIEMAPMTKPDYSPEMPINRISSLFQRNNRPLIKGWTRSRSGDFTELLAQDFVDAANVLQGTRWTINTAVLEAIQDYTDEFIKPHQQVPSEAGPERKEAQRTNSRSMANRTILELAHNLMDQDGFYQYVDFDWRGRIYYCENFLNYQGNDLAKGLMMFYEGKPLGTRGQFWLAVHTANSFNPSFNIDELPDYFEEDYAAHLRSQGLQTISVDKMTLQDRASWTRENLEMIIYAGEEGILCPDAEKGVTALACCIEWYKLLVHWDDYVCHLPIPVDGSNNGWQHLGAMSKDPRTGSLVGLEPTTIPNDFYVKCAQKLQEIAPEWFAERDIPMKDVRKGIAKRGAMTRAYSAGKTTIAENMYDDIWKEEFDKKYKITKEDCTYLADNLVKAIEQVCPGPMETMNYLQRLADHEISMGNTEVTWTSPSGFPVVQKYSLTTDEKKKSRIIPIAGTMFPPEMEIGTAVRAKGKRKGSKGPIIGYDGRINHALRIYLDDRPDYKKIVSAISPNFVHSMDAAHMALVISRWDGDFGAVHDSFSTHACYVDELVELTKDVFIELYEVENFFDDMRENVLTDQTGFEDNQPEIGTLDVSMVRHSDFFFA